MSFLMNSKDPLHGITLERLLRCFNFDPSIKSSLTFLRRIPWARKKLEGLLLSY